MKQYRLFLDDVRMPYEVGNYISPVDLRKEYRLHEWVIVRNYDEFVKYITENGLPTHVSFDHDLADIHYDPSTWTESFQYQEETGLDCAKWMCNYILENKLSLCVYYIHSLNPVGAKNINNYMASFIKHYNADKA